MSDIPLGFQYDPASPPDRLEILPWPGEQKRGHGVGIRCSQVREKIARRRGSSAATGPAFEAGATQPGDLEKSLHSSGGKLFFGGGKRGTRIVVISAKH